MNDQLGDSEPIDIEELVKVIHECADIIPVQVLRRGRMVNRYLSECKAHEITGYIYESVREGRMPSVAYARRRRVMGKSPLKSMEEEFGRKRKEQ